MITIWQAVAIAALSGGVGVLIGVALWAACALAGQVDDMQGRE